MKSVLLIEDHKENRENFSEILELSGYRVFTAQNGEAGLKIAKENPPDLILSDIQMKGMDGFELKKMLNEWWKENTTFNIPFVFLTACSAPADIQRARELGVQAYLKKPVEISEVLETIENLIPGGG